MGQQSFGCKVCSVKITYSSTLRTHLRLRMGEQSFSCEVCDKKFKQKCSFREFTCIIFIHVNDRLSAKPFCIRITCSRAITYENGRIF